MTDDIQTVQTDYAEAMEMLWRQSQTIKRLQQENEKLRAALDCFLEQSTPTQWRYSRERAEKLAKGILAAAALKETTKGQDES